MSPQPLVSVVIPVHGRQEMLCEAIESVRGQAFRDWELIVVDDGSPQSLGDCVRRFADSRIAFLRQPRGGVSRARNTGIRASRAQWLAFLDSDDLWKPTKLQRQLEELERRPGYRLAHTEEIWMRRGKRVNPRKIHRKHEGWIYEKCLPRCVVSPSSVLVHRQVLRERGAFDESYPVCEDYELWLRLAARLPFLFLPEALIVKRGGHPDQLSKSLWGMDRFRVRALIKTFRSAGLPPRLKRLTAAETSRKSSILAIGCAKRGRPQEAGEYARLAVHWESQARLAGTSRPWRRQPMTPADSAFFPLAP